MVYGYSSSFPHTNADVEREYHCRCLVPYYLISQSIPYYVLP